MSDAAAGGPAQDERHLLLRTETFFGQRSPLFAFVFGVAFCLVVELLDSMVLDRISFALFSLMPIGLIAWHLGRRAGAAIAIVAAAGGVLGDVIGGQNSVVPYGNGMARAVVGEAVRGAARRERSRAGSSGGRRSFRGLPAGTRHAAGGRRRQATEPARV